MLISVGDLDLVSKKRIVQKSRHLQGVGHTMMGGGAALGALNRPQEPRLALPGVSICVPTAC